MAAAPGDRGGLPRNFLRIVALAMAAGIVPIAVVALLLAPAEPVPGRGALLAGISVLALGSIVVGIVLAIGAAGAEPGKKRSDRILVSLALREVGGLIGLVPAFFGAGWAVPVALAAASIASLLALLPPAGD